MQQLAVTLSKEYTQIQNFGNVKQEVLIDNFSKHSRGYEVLLWKRSTKPTQGHRLKQYDKALI